ncbi:MAG TPA: choline/ethanolamine kinase family protein [Solirubrobacterales bacterium]|nr:choline/ethanolamine kinase family protein [Solirubrobacterales bacterium]
MRTRSETGARPWGGHGPAVSFAAEVDAASRAEIEAVLVGWDPGLFPGGEVEVSVLLGGANNRNFVARTAEAKYALRIANPQNERFAVDRAAALQAQRDAAAGGIAPAVAACQLPAGHVLSAFVEGVTLSGSRELGEPEVLENVGRTLRRLHALPSSIRAFSPFDDIRLFVRMARGDGTEIPDDLDDLLAAVARIEALMATAELPAAFCHNDTVPQNFIRSGSRLTLVDWDYAGRGWACFELASFCATADLGPELQEVLLRSYDAETSEAQLATLELLKFVAAMREATWALMAAPILAGTTTPDSDDFYENYMRDYLRLARQRAAAPDFDPLIKTAAAGRGPRSW